MTKQFVFEDAREEGLFRRAGRRNLTRQILNSLKRGENPHFENVDHAALEYAAALQQFLSDLKTPVMPRHVQQLILGNFIDRSVKRRFIIDQ